MTNIIKISIITVFIVFISISCASAEKSDFYSSPEALGSTRFSEAPEVNRASNVPENNRMITYSVSLELSVKNVDDTLNKILEQVNTNNGFITRTTESVIAARIPSENMDDFLNYAKTLGNVDSERKTGTDITDQYRNDVIRLDSLKNVRNRYLVLLERANNVNDMLSIERELERVVFEIEKLEGRIQQAELNVAYSNITVRVREKVRPGPIGWVFYGLYHGVKWLFVW